MNGRRWDTDERGEGIASGAAFSSNLQELADEPTGHQDAGWASRIMWTLRSAAGAGSCCVIATHDRELIDQLDRVDSMSDGRLTG